MWLWGAGDSTSGDYLAHLGYARAKAGLAGLVDSHSTRQSSPPRLGVASSAQGLVFAPAPVRVLRNRHVLKVAAGDHHNLALTDDGYIYSWGRYTDTKIQWYVRTCVGVYLCVLACVRASVSACLPVRTT